MGMSTLRYFDAVSAYCAGVEQRRRLRPASASFRTIIQRRRAGSLLTRLGLRRSSAAFTSTTSPLTGAIQLGHRLHRFDRAERLSPVVSVAPDLGQLDVDDVAELLLRVVGDADAPRVAGRR